MLLFDYSMFKFFYEGERLTCHELELVDQETIAALLFLGVSPHVTLRG